MVLVLNSKKAASMGLFEIILVVSVLFIVGVVWLVTNNIGDDVSEFLLDDDDFFTNNESRSTMNDLQERQSSFFNGGFALFFIGIFLVGVISAWYSTNNPIFMVVVFLMIIMVLIIPVFLGDAWDDISEEFGGNNISFMNWVLDNYLIFSVVFVFVILGVMFFKGRYID